MKTKFFTQYSFRENNTIINISVIIDSMSIRKRFLIGTYGDKEKARQKSPEGRVISKRADKKRYPRADRRRWIKAWRNRNMDRVRKLDMDRYKRDKPKRLLLVKKSSHRRKRELGFISLNEYEPNFDAHHISKDYIIFIPHEVHLHNDHNLKTGEGMKEINQIAFAYLLPGVNWEGDVF